MRLLAATFVLSCLLTGCADTPYQPTTAREREVSPYVQNMKANRDNMEGVTYYTSPGMLLAPFSMYTASFDNKNVVLRLSAHYDGTRWIFFNRIEISVDGLKIYDKHFDSLAVKHRVENNLVFEDIDYPASAADLAALHKITGAKSVVIRLSGQDMREYNLRDSTITKLTQSLAAYDAIAASGKPVLAGQ